jgi:hypothetical protein
MKNDAHARARQSKCGGRGGMKAEFEELSGTKKRAAMLPFKQD